MGSALQLDVLARLDTRRRRVWPEDTLGILTLIQEHQGSGTKKWGANHEGLPRATVDRLVREQLVQEVYMSGEPVTAETARKHARKKFPTLLVTTEAGDAIAAGAERQAAGSQGEQEGAKPAQERQKAKKKASSRRRDPKLAKLLARFDADKLVHEWSGIRVGDSVRRGRGKEIGRVLGFVEPRPGWHRALIRWADAEQYVDVGELVPPKGPQRKQAASKGTAWPEDTLGILTLIQKHQRAGTQNRHGAFDGLPRATIDRLVTEQLVEERYMSGRPVRAKTARRNFPTFLVTTEAGDAIVAAGQEEGVPGETAGRWPRLDVLARLDALARLGKAT